MEVWPAVSSLVGLPGGSEISPSDSTCCAFPHQTARKASIPEVALDDVVKLERGSYTQQPKSQQCSDHLCEDPQALDCLQQKKQEGPMGPPACLKATRSASLHNCMAHRPRNVHILVHAVGATTQPVSDQPNQFLDLAIT